MPHRRTENTTDFMINLLPERFITWEGGLGSQREWIAQLRSGKAPWFKGFSHSRVLGCFGGSYKPVSVKGLEGLFLFIFLLGTQCLLFEERKQKNGSQFQEATWKRWEEQSFGVSLYEFKLGYTLLRVFDKVLGYSYSLFSLLNNN